MQITTSTPSDDSIKQFIRLVQGAIEDLLKAGSIAARCIDENPEWIDKVCDLCPDLTPEFVKRFESLGRGRISPKLFLSETPGARRLRKLPIELQNKFAVEPLPVVIGDETLLIDVRNLTPDQALQVFDLQERSIRSEAAQRSFREDQQKQSVARVQSLPYRIVRGEVIIGDQRFTRKEIAQILLAMEQ